MTATLQRETLPLSGDQFYDSARAIASAVEARLDDLTSPDTDAHDFFYGENGISAVPFGTMPFPYGQNLWVQDETLHRGVNHLGEDTGVPTFKIRGARAAGYAAICDNPGLEVLSSASAGNHGQGVASTANELGVKAEIHVSRSASEVKKGKMRALGAKVIEHPTFGHAMAAAKNDTDPRKAFIHPFNNVDVIAGQATVGYEMLQSLYAKENLGLVDLHHDEVTFFAPLGGGGLVSGIAVAVKKAKDAGKVGNNVRVVPVQIEQKETNEWCDGTLTRTGNIASVILSDSRFTDKTLVVPEVWVAEAMVNLQWQLAKNIEPAGALALAGALWAGRTSRENTGRVPGHFVVPVTGASVTAESFGQAMQLRHEAYCTGAELPSLTSRYVYDDTDVFSDRVWTSVGSHVNGLLNSNQYGPYQSRA